jgi:hypothetical protein
MRFSYSGKTYSLDFSRNFKPVNPVGKSGDLGKFDMSKKLSKYPYTVATLYEVVEGQKGSEWPIVADAEVGCLVGADKFTLESGRLYALKKLTKGMENGLKAAIWDTYIKRPRAGKQTKRQLRAEIDRLTKELKTAQAQIVTLSKNEGSY